MFQNCNLGASDLRTLWCIICGSSNPNQLLDVYYFNDHYFNKIFVVNNKMENSESFTKLFNDIIG